MAERTTFPNFALPGFIVDPQSVDRDNGHQIDWDNVGEEYRETKGGTIIVSGALSASATSTVIPLEGEIDFDIPAGTLLYFGQAGEYAKVAVAAAAGVSAITVTDLASNIEDGDTATISGSGLKTIKAGTAMGIASDGTMYPRVASTNPADGLLATTAVEGEKHAALSGYGLIIGGVVYETLLPQADDDALSAIKVELAANSKGFVYREYEDDRAE